MEKELGDFFRCTEEAQVAVIRAYYEQGCPLRQIPYVPDWPHDGIMKIMSKDSCPCDMSGAVATFESLAPSLLSAGKEASLAARESRDCMPSDRPPRRESGLAGQVAWWRSRFGLPLPLTASHPHRTTAHRRGRRTRS